MSATNTWDQVVEKIAGVTNQGSYSYSSSTQIVVSLQPGYYSGISINTTNLYNNAYNDGVAYGRELQLSYIKYVGSISGYNASTSTSIQTNVYTVPDSGAYIFSVFARLTFTQQNMSTKLVIARNGVDIDNYVQNSCATTYGQGGGGGALSQILQLVSGDQIYVYANYNLNGPYNYIWCGIFQLDKY